MHIEQCLPKLSLWAILLRSYEYEYFLKICFMLSVRQIDIFHIFASEVSIQEKQIFLFIIKCFSSVSIITSVCLIIKRILSVRKTKIIHSPDDQLHVTNDHNDLITISKQMDKTLRPGILLINVMIIIINCFLRIHLKYHFDLTMKSVDQSNDSILIAFVQSFFLVILQVDDIIIIIGSLLATFSYHCFVSSNDSHEINVSTNEQTCHLIHFREHIQSQAKYFAISTTIDCAVDCLIVIKFLQVHSLQLYQFMILALTIGNLCSRLMLRYWIHDMTAHIRRNLETILGHPVSSMSEVNKWMALVSSQFNEAAVMFATMVIVCAMKHPFIKSLYFIHGRAILGVSKNYLASLDRKLD